MTDARSAWNETGEQLTALGSKLGAHYEKKRGTDGERARAETNEAIKRLGDAVQDAFEAVGAAAKDDGVRQDVKQVSRSLVGALDATFREVSSEVRKAFDRSGTPAAEGGTTDPASTPAPTPSPTPAPTAAQAPAPAPAPAPAEPAYGTDPATSGEPGSTPSGRPPGTNPAE